ncbi:NAD(P)/FAD-dependent oxidoreductase [Deinococcus sp. RIT780]|nr:NAD(P)/FAD-dependent oxidoreductase [Deinococcus sp. RIT780]
MHLRPTRPGRRAILPSVTDHAAPVVPDTSLLDVLIVGGGFAGLSAALYTARGMKSGILISSGPSRNAPSPHAGGVFSRDRRPPEEILAAARDDLRPYDFPVMEAEVTAISGGNGDFTATLSTGETVRARKVILATGVRDVLPGTPAGLREQWGRGVHHCPYCYGWELRGGQVAVHLPGLSGVGGVQSGLYPQKLTRDVLVCADGAADLTPAHRALLLEHGVTLIEEPLVRVDGRAGGGVTLTFQSGLTVDRDVLYAHGRRELRAELAEALGCEVTTSGITVDAQQMTTVPGVYACGDVTKGNQIAFAVAGGAMAAMQAAYAIFYDTLPDGARVAVPA